MGNNNTKNQIRAMNIGIIGAGEMGLCLASKFIKSGHRVSMANSRGPDSFKQVAGNIGAEATTVEEVTENKKVVIISIPEKSIPNLPKSIFTGLPGHVVVIDTGNYYPTLRDGILPGLDQSGIDSLWVQQQLAVPIVKVFNSILATSINVLGKPRGEKDRIAIAVSGDDAIAKEVVFRLVDELGFDPFDIGLIQESWKQQPGSPIYCRDINLSTVKKRVEELGSDWSQMRHEILSKRKTDEALMKTDYPAYLRTLQRRRF
ncbi:NADPH-dependent F420 reductase [Flavitalea flava]